VIPVELALQRRPAGLGDVFDGATPCSTYLRGVILLSDRDDSALIIEG